jgi:hypothetical protein
MRVALNVCLILYFFAVPTSRAQVNIFAERYDNSRTGSNLSETQLNTSNVNVSQFGKLWTYPVDGSIQAQPLYVSNLAISGQGNLNVLFVVTMNDVIYALNADSNAGPNGGVLWKRDFRNPTAGVTPVPIRDIVGTDGLNITGNVGIESTPVIDPTSNTIYLVVRTKETSGSSVQYFQRLHALDITNGNGKFGGPTVIQGSVKGIGTASSGATITFNALIHNQRASLAIANGMIFIAWASHEDLNPYHGWIMTYNAQTLQQSGIFNSSPNGSEGGIWMAGHAPAVDSIGNVYYTVGNGDWDGTTNFGESLLKFSTSSGGLSLVDWFTPDNWSTLNGTDADLGSTGPLLVPGTNLLVGGGKQSVFYVVQLSNLGHEQSGNGQIVQHFSTGGGQIKGGPVFWNRTTGAGPTMYVWADNDYLKAFHFNGSSFDTSPISKSTFQDPSGSSGGVLTISSNGSTSGTGIVWSSMPLSQDGDHGTVQGVIRAFDANNLTNELWNSEQNSSRDSTGLWPKFSPPTVINGKMYMASFSNVLNVYGLISGSPDFTISGTPATSSVNQGGNVSYTISVGALNGFTGSVSLSVSGLPGGAVASVNPTSVGAGGSSTLTVSTTSSTPTGSSTLTVTGTSGSLTHTATVTLTVSASSSYSGNVISVDFVGTGTPMGSAEVAGVVAKSHWNNATGTSNGSTPLSLVDETGGATGATVTWSADNLHSLPIQDQPGTVRMMAGYLDDHYGNPTTVTVSGLGSNANGYSVYVYADGDNGSATRSGTYQISGAGITTTSITLTDPANTNFSGTFAQANNTNGNYVVFTIHATAFTLSVTPKAASDGTMRAPVNGIQIMPL